MALKEVKKWPPNIQQIQSVFDIKGVDVCFSYGDTIYNPSGNYIDTPLLAHEATHSAQQERLGSPEVWWHKYLTDKPFRKEQELEAYREQYKVFCMFENDRNYRARFAFKIASDFSSKIYGSIISFSDAYKAITQ